MTWPILDLAAFFTGSWRMIRRIHDGRIHRIGRMAGVATFTPVRQGIAYEEQGILGFGDWRGTATRRYLYVLDDSATAEVRFEDGRHFHALDLSSGAASVDHHCSRDLYRGLYRVLSPARWRVAWRIEGPRKDLLILTRYVRDVQTPVQSGDSRVLF